MSSRCGIDDTTLRPTDGNGSKSSGRAARPVVLILGGGIMQTPAIRLAKRAGWTVIVADFNPEAPGIRLADDFEHIDLADRFALAAVAVERRRSGRLDGVFTAGTDFSTTVAWVAAECGLPGIPYETALAATDKILMRRTLTRAGVPCPEYVGLSRGDDPRSSLRRLRLPVVVKPVDNMGSRGVRRVDSPQELEEAFDRAAGLSRSGRVIVEAFMDGPEISVDAIVHQGRVTICGAADRHIGFAPYFVELGHTMPSALPTSLLRRAADVFRRGVAALGIDNGAAKGDIKLTSSGPMIGEIAARLSGGFMSGWTYPYASGVEVTQAALNLAVGLPPGPLEPMVHRVSAERALISIPGEIDDIVGCEDVVSVRDTRDLFLLSERGDRVHMPTNNVEKCGNVVTCADTREEAVAAADTAVGRVLFRLVPGHPDTESFLRSRPSEASGHGPNAYSLENAANLAALSAMPERITGSGGPDILELPCIEAELEKDWTHLRLKEAVDRIAAMTGARFVDRPTARRACLGRVFWRALLRGGVQAGVYVIDTERSENSRSERSRQDYAVTARARSGGA